MIIVGGMCVKRLFGNFAPEFAEFFELQMSLQFAVEIHLNINDWSILLLWLTKKYQNFNESAVAS